MSKGPYVAKTQHQLIKALKASTAAATLVCLLGVGSQLAIAEQPGDRVPQRTRPGARRSL